MVGEHHTQILEQILDLLDTACQADLELLNLYSYGDTPSAQTLLTDLRSVVQAVASAQEPLLPQLEHAYTTEMLENVEDTLDDIQRSIEAGNSDRAVMKMEFQLFPFLRCLREAFYFWGMIYPDETEMERYYREEFAGHYRNYYINDDEPAKCRLSIAIPAYNHIETTKLCIEYLLKETNFEKLNAELILIDHGSSDGTLKYFESLGIGKVIHFKHNVRMYMIATLFQLCQGKYFTFFNNDLLATKNWAEILLQCLESDANIISVSPATPNTANLQMVMIPSDDPKTFINWANGRNQSKPDCWNDRVRLMPTLGVYRSAAVNRIGFADPYFYSMEFWDDDFSFRARRAGYRQVLCDDVACYHFGSKTGKGAQKKEKTLVYGRKLFKKKNGVDAWGNGFCYDYSAVQLFKQIFLSQGKVTLLGLDCGMGDTPLQLRNELRRHKQGFDIYQLTCQTEYLADLQALFENTAYTSDMPEGLDSAFDTLLFSHVYLSRDIGEYENWTKLLENVSKRLDLGGYFVFSCANPFYAVTLYRMLQFTVPEDSSRYILMDPMQVRAETEKYFSQVQLVPMEQSVEGLESFAKQHFRIGEQLSETISRLKIQKYYFLCRK